MRTARRGSGKGAKRIRRGETGFLAEGNSVCFEVGVEARSLRDVWDEEVDEAEDAEPSGELDGDEEFERRSCKRGLGMTRGDVAVVAIGREQRLIKWAPNSFKMADREPNLIPNGPWGPTHVSRFIILLPSAEPRPYVPDLSPILSLFHVLSCSFKQ